FYAFGIGSSYVWLFLILGIGAIAAAVKYTVGKTPYGYQGLGDLFVLIFFGLVGVVGSYFLHVQYIHQAVILPALSCGLFAVGVLNVNNVRDIASDRIAGKRSIPVRLGKKRASIYHVALLATGWLLMLLFSVSTAIHPLQWLYWLAFPLFVRNALAVVRKEGPDLDPYLKQLAIFTLLFVLLYGLGMLLMALT
ncbi:MAG: 1,4-dihydroxy-2-naphthoate octaprenyltransferase, partial [Bacteroidota bacterium]